MFSNGETCNISVKVLNFNTEMHLWWYRESSEGVSVQDVRPRVVDEDVGADLIQRPVGVQLYFLEVLGVLGAPVELHLPLYGSWREQ